MPRSWRRLTEAGWAGETHCSWAAPFQAPRSWAWLRALLGACPAPGQSTRRRRDPPAQERARCSPAPTPPLQPGCWAQATPRHGLGGAAECGLSTRLPRRLRGPTPTAGWPSVGRRATARRWPRGGRTSSSRHSPTSRAWGRTRAPLRERSPTGGPGGSLPANPPAPPRGTSLAPPRLCSSRSRGSTPACTTTRTTAPGSCGAPTPGTRRATRRCCGTRRWPATAAPAWTGAGAATASLLATACVTAPGRSPGRPRGGRCGRTRAGYAWPCAGRGAAWAVSQPAGGSCTTPPGPRTHPPAPSTRRAAHRPAGEPASWCSRRALCSSASTSPSTTTTQSRATRRRGSRWSSAAGPAAPLSGRSASPPWSSSTTTLTARRRRTRCSPPPRPSWGLRCTQLHASRARRRRESSPPSQACLCPRSPTRGRRRSARRS